MCGLAGFAGKGNEGDLRRMIAKLRHRGPDNEQVIVRDGVGFGHARLSIIDPAPEANQPFFSADGKLMIIFNGEIYNFLELRERLEVSNSQRFRTSSDTEVILALYAIHGEDLLQHLSGMFAFAIYDFEKRKLVVARDRLGEKPLYYAHEGDTVVFGSEIKALLPHPAVSRDIDLQGLHQYLTFDYVPGPRSIFGKIHKLEPGSYFVFQDGQLKNKKYWDIRFGQSTLSFEEATHEFSRRLEESVAGKLISDVPLGFFLSGGIDSSTVAYFAQKNSSTRIRTFSVGFENASYDESAYARQVAEQLGSLHTSEVLTEKEAVELIPGIAQQVDEPFADPSIIPTYLLARFTRKNVTVALGGDGSDELLAGYPTFIADRFVRPARALGSVARLALKSAAALMPVSDENIGTDFKVAQFLKGLGVSEDYTHPLWLSSFTPQMTRELWQPSIYKQLSSPDYLEPVDRIFQSRGDVTGRFHRDALVYCKTYLPDDILFKVDRASMLTSLEVRAPFLDHTLVDFLTSLPEGYKRQGINTKRILKAAMRGKLPDNIIGRPKKGFGIPLSAWLKKDLRKLCDDLLSHSSLSRHGFFNQEYVDRLRREHYTSRKNNRKELWNLMIFQLWYDNHIR